MHLLIASANEIASHGFLRRVAAVMPTPPTAEIVVDGRTLRAVLASGRSADVVIVDLGLDGLEPIDGIAELHLAWPKVRFVATAALDDPYVEIDVARAGARAFLPLSASPIHAARVLEIIAQGSSYMSTAALLTVSDEISQASHALIVGSVGAVADALTYSEARILAHVRRGASNRAIGEAVGLNENRVKLCLKTIFRKIGARNRTEAAIKAAELMALPEISCSQDLVALSA
jgi:DNA-binding NarL/FixJ family response regulator